MTCAPRVEIIMSVALTGLDYSSMVVGWHAVDLFAPKII
jgi:hypothetical protein